MICVYRFIADNFFYNFTNIDPIKDNILHTVKLMHLSITLSIYITESMKKDIYVKIMEFSLIFMVFPRFWKFFY